MFSVYINILSILFGGGFVAAITLSVPDELKNKMDKTDWINWSSVARKAFAETLSDLHRLEVLKKVEEISEIAPEDNRELKEEFANETIKAAEKAGKEIKSGKRKLLAPKDFDDWCKKYEL